MEEGNITSAVQRYLNQLNKGPAHHETVRRLLGRAAGRLQLLCATMLHNHYRRLTRGPLSVERDELLSAVVVRLIKALREIRPATSREFFGLASRHIRWELNDLAQRLDKERAVSPIADTAAAAESCDSLLSVDGRRILAAIEALPEDEGEVFNLIRIHGLSHSEAAELLGVATKTIQRRLNRALLLLAQHLKDLAPESEN